ncbi:MAG: PDZ domain-containing protein, partial [Chloroflexi bacterium]|nr:PDZ domain-containing protein [Chloroflexota bacterium]
MAVPLPQSQMPMTASLPLSAVDGRRHRPWLPLTAVAFGVLYLVLLGTAWLAIMRYWHAMPVWALRPTEDGGLVVMYVDPHGPAGQAGIGRGDTVLSWNSIPIGDTAAVRRAIDGQHPGDRAIVRVRRAPEGSLPSVEQDVSLMLEAPRSFVEVVAQHVVGLLFLGIAIVVAVARPEDSASRLLLVVGASGALAFLGPVVPASILPEVRSRLYLGGPIVSLVALAHLMNLVAGTAALHLFLAFPPTHPLLRRLRAAGPAWLRRAGGATVLLYAAPFAAWTFLFVNRDLPGSETALYVVLLVLLGGAAAGLAHSYLRPATPLTRAQVSWILLSFILFLTHMAWSISRMAGVAWLPQPPWWTFTIASSAIPLAVGFAILRYRLFEVGTLLRATISYTLLAALAWVVGYTAATVSLDRIVGLQADTPAAREVQRRLDRLIYRERRAREQFLQEAAEFLGQAQPPEAVAGFLTSHASVR